jgi:hypothetical protein
MPKRILILLIIFSVFSNLRATANPFQTGDTITAYKIDERIEIDGVLDEEAWTRGNPVTGFIQYTPNEGEPAAEPTKVTVLYDEAALYIGFI